MVQGASRVQLVLMAGMEKRESVAFQGKMAKMDLTANKEFKV
jgi:hypothetical protein